MNMALMAVLCLVAQAGERGSLCFKDFYDIMEKSTLVYSISEQKAPVEDTTSTPLPISMDSKVKESDKGLEVITFERKKKAAKLVEELEIYYRNKNNVKVRELCLKVLDIDSSDSKMLAYLCETYFVDKDIASAIKWGEKAVEANRNNWFAHMMLGRCYMAKADTSESYRFLCLKELATAMILNRRVSVLESSYQNVCKKYGREFKAWSFVPQCNIWEDKKTIHIETDPNWLGYAVAKAVRTFEPGYKYKKEKKWSFSEDTQKESELLMNLASGCAAEIEDTLRPVITPKEGVKDPSIIALFKAVNNGMLNEYIFFEIWTPKTPLLAHCLPKESFDKLVQYVLTVRTEDK